MSCCSSIVILRPVDSAEHIVPHQDEVALRAAQEAVRFASGGRNR